MRLDGDHVGVGRGRHGGRGGRPVGVAVTLTLGCWGHEGGRARGVADALRAGAPVYVVDLKIARMKIDYETFEYENNLHLRKGSFHTCGIDRQGHELSRLSSLLRTFGTRQTRRKLLVELSGDEIRFRLSSTRITLARGI